MGCVFRPQYPPESLIPAARAAEDAGLDELWLWEDCFLSAGISSAAIALASTSALTVGVGVLPVPMRNVAATAMEIATLGRTFPGRVRIGVGHGVQDWMGLIGAKVASPMTLLGEYLRALRLLLDGGSVTVDGRYVKLDGVQLDWPPEPGMELLCAAMGPKTLTLSGELASGTVLGGGTTPEMVRNAVQTIGATDATTHSVVTYLHCSIGSEARRRAQEEAGRWDLDGELDDLAVYGSPQDIAASARRWIDAGADTVVFQPEADVDIIDFVTTIGTDVQPRLTA